MGVSNPVEPAFKIKPLQYYKVSAEKLLTIHNAYFRPITTTFLNEIFHHTKFTIMKKITVFIILIAICLNSSAQQSKYSLEINPFMRYDRYKEFFSWETATGGENYISPRGTSFGLNLNIKNQINPASNIYLGLGYYKHTISNIKRTNNRGNGNDRLIDFPSPLFIFFYSDKYAYNTVTLNAGFERHFRFKKNYLITTGIDLNGLYTFSQYYHLTRNPGGSQDYRKKNAGFFGILAGFDIGLMKSYRQFNIGPKLKIPVFSSLKTDATFPNETGTYSRNQWFSGIGLGVSFNYKFKTSKK